MGNGVQQSGIGILVISAAETTLTMEMRKYIWIFGFMAITCLSSNGSALPLRNEEDDRYYPDNDGEPFDMQSSVFDPNSDWDPRDDDRIENVLKRSGFQMSDSYQRYPRIKEKVIIPFYSYGKNPGYYRSKPRMLAGPRVYFGYNPWSVDSYRGGNRFPSSGAYRY